MLFVILTAPWHFCRRESVCRKRIRTSDEEESRRVSRSGIERELKMDSVVETSRSSGEVEKKRERLGFVRWDGAMDSLDCDSKRQKSRSEEQIDTDIEFH